MSDVPDITVSELRVAIGRILHVVEVEFGEELRFPVDYYWHVMKDAYAVYDDPELGMGQVSDDASTVRNFVTRPRMTTTASSSWRSVNTSQGCAPADTPRPRPRPWRLRAERP